MNMLFRNITCGLLLMLAGQLGAQPMMADKIVAVVGKNHILYSEVEDQYMQYKAQGVKPLPTRCEIVEELLTQKLLVNQAAIDSIEVDESQVEQEMNSRVKYFISQFGTEDKMVAYFGKSIIEIKEDMRDAVRDQMLMQRMQSEITSGSQITPSEVRNYYNSLPKDSIPYINAEVEINQILMYPATSQEAVYEVRERLLNIRERILNGENFATLAVLYSEDGSASHGGDLGWASKGDFDPEFTKAALALKNGQVSKIVESSFGYHLIQMIDRTDERFHVRHIIMKPKITFEEKEKTINRMDSVLQLIRIDTLTFEEAAEKFSEDEKSKENGGQVVNPQSGNTRFELDHFDTKEYYLIRNLQIGEMSKAYETVDETGKLVYKVVRLKSRTEPHVANIRQDYELLKQMANRSKQDELVNEWIADKVKSTYIRISEPYNNCTFQIKGWLGE